MVQTDRFFTASENVHEKCGCVSIFQIHSNIVMLDMCTILFSGLDLHCCSWSVLDNRVQKTSPLPP